MKFIKDYYVLFSLVVLVISYILILNADNTFAHFLGGEDMLFESGTAIWFAVAGIIFIVLYKRDKQGNVIYKFRFKKNVFYLFFGILFLFAAGEEISWGQRIFNIETPDSFKERNIQGEMNLHNLDIFHSKDHNKQRKTGIWGVLTMGRLFTAFWFVLCVLIPIINHYNSRFAQWLKKINIPVITISLGIVFLLNHIFSKIVEALVDDPDYMHYITEIKEHNFGLLFLLMGILLLNRQRKAATTPQAV